MSDEKTRIYNVVLKGEAPQIILLPEMKRNTVSKRVNNSELSKVFSVLVKADNLVLYAENEMCFYYFFLDGQRVAVFPVETVLYVTSREAYIMEDPLTNYQEGGAAE